MALEIDLGVHGVTTPVQSKSTWKPPRHVYFGPRDPMTGDLGEEPVYVHQEYPRLVYKLDGEKIKAAMINSAGELSALGEGWVKNPGELGYIGAPTLEQSFKMAEEEAARQRELEEKNAAIALGVAIKRRKAE